MTTQTPQVDIARALVELERRRKANPPAFYEPANEKIADFHRCPATVRLLCGGNRAGKTEAALQEVVWHVLGNHPYQPVPQPPVYWRIVTVDFNQLEKVICEKLSRMIPPRFFRQGSWSKTYNSRTHIITLTNGSKIDLMTHDQELLAFEGSARHGTLFDEEPPEDIYTSCIMRHVDYGGKAILSMTPLKGLTWVYSKIYLRSFVDSDIRSWTLSIYENRFLDNSSIKDIESLVSDDIEKEIRLYGRFASRAGLVFRNFNADLHVYDPQTYQDWWDGDYPPAGWLHVVGIDPGWGHPTGVIWLAVNPDTGDSYFYREHKASEMLPEEHAEVIHVYNAEMGIIDPVYVIDSQARATDQQGGSVWDAYRRSGIVARTGTKKLHESNMMLERLMRPTVNPLGKQCSLFHVSKECPMFIEEIGEYQRAKPSPTSGTERYVDRKNDLISAARYAYWEASRIDFDQLSATRSRSRKADLVRRSPIRREPVEPARKRRGSPTTGY